MDSFQDTLRQIVQDFSVSNKDPGKGFSCETTFLKIIYAPLQSFIFSFVGQKLRRLKTCEQTSVRGPAINPIFILTKQMIVPSFASSAASKATVDGQKSSAAFSAIFIFGTGVIAPHTKWKPIKAPFFKSTASELEAKSIDFDGTNFYSRADGPSYNYRPLAGRQERNVDVLKLKAMLL